MEEMAKFENRLSGEIFDQLRRDIESGEPLHDICHYETIRKVLSEFRVIEARDLLAKWLAEAEARPPTRPGGWYDIGTVSPEDVEKARGILKA
jgi:hypothetical protein